MTLKALILEKLGEIGEGEARIWRALLGLDNKYRFSKRSFSSLLSQLRAQNLIERSGARRKTQWKLTKLGKEYLHKRNQAVPKKDGVRRLVIFDIPEDKKSKREVIRRELINIGYTQLQKSVWMGEFALPSEFIELLDILNLHSMVHIFSVKESGTLKN
ncbi:MAG: hypothetical protein HYT39_03865 [Candidatus Sungbacteria bacterium]|nr:hypothetical protein [Candidatus Sungbacteria bacterium]